MVAEAYAAEWNIALRLHSFMQFPYFIDDENAYKMSVKNGAFLVAKSYAACSRNTCNFMVVLWVYGGGEPAGARDEARVTNKPAGKQFTPFHASEFYGTALKHTHTRTHTIRYALDYAWIAFLYGPQKHMHMNFVLFVLQAGIALLLLCSMLFDNKTTSSILVVPDALLLLLLLFTAHNLCMRVCVSLYNPCIWNAR